MSFFDLSLTHDNDAESSKLVWVATVTASLAPFAFFDDWSSPWMDAFEGAKAPVEAPLISP